MTVQSVFNRCLLNGRGASQQEKVLPSGTCGNNRGPIVGQSAWAWGQLLLALGVAKVLQYVRGSYQ